MTTYIIRVVTKGVSITKDRIVSFDKFGNRLTTTSLEEARQLKGAMEDMHRKADYQIYELTPVRE